MKSIATENKEKLESALMVKGWKKDRFGHWHKQVAYVNRQTKEETIRETRIKMKDSSCRVEVKAEGSQWMKKYSSYFKNLSITHEGVISIERFIVQ